VNHPPAQPAKASDTRGFWDRWTGPATVIGLPVGLLSLLVGVFAWRSPVHDDDKSKGGAATAATTPALGVTTPASPAGGPGAAAPSGTATAPPGPAPVYLASGTVGRVLGQTVPLPRQIVGKPTYDSHSIVLHCPGSGDRFTSVGYALSRHYIQFDATVHPYYPPGADQKSATNVDVTLVTTDPSGHDGSKPVGSRYDATPSAPKTITGELDGGDRLILNVECADQDGYVVLTDARLTPA
jgi:hypothetical protein